jgi:hypothetical protein
MLGNCQVSTQLVASRVFFIYIYIYIFIYLLLTAIGLMPSGSAVTVLSSKELITSFFEYEDGGSMFVRNIAKLPDYKASRLGYHGKNAKVRATLAITARIIPRHPARKVGVTPRQVKVCTGAARAIGNGLILPNRFQFPI